MNSNGILSVGGEEFLYFQQARFPLDSRWPPLIAPFWTDFNPSAGGNIYYRQTNDSDLLQAVESVVQDSDNEDLNSFSPTHLFIATWDEVPPFSRTVV